MNPSFEALFETGVDEMCWDDTVSLSLTIKHAPNLQICITFFILSQQASYHIGLFDERCVFLQENYRMGGAYQWPGLNEVMQYRKFVRQLVCDVINSAPLSLPVTMENPWVSE